MVSIADNEQQAALMNDNNSVFFWKVIRKFENILKVSFSNKTSPE